MLIRIALLAGLLFGAYHYGERAYGSTLQTLGDVFGWMLPP